MTNVDTLLALLKEATAEAERLGPGAGRVVRTLEQVGAEVRALAGPDGKPDEGQRPEQLSSANDG